MDILSKSTKELIKTNEFKAAFDHMMQQGLQEISVEVKDKTFTIRKVNF